MSERERMRGDLEFERVVGPADLRLSRSFATPGGDQVRAVITVGGRAVLTPARSSQGGLDTLVVDGVGDDAVAKSFLGNLWDKVKDKVGDMIGDIIGGDGGGGGGQKCTTTTNVTVGPNGQVTGITTTTTCGPA